MNFLVTLNIFSIQVHFKLIYNRVMTNKILFKINLADSSTYSFCNREEAVIYALLECKRLLDPGGALNVG